MLKGPDINTGSGQNPLKGTKPHTLWPGSQGINEIHGTKSLGSHTGTPTPYRDPHPIPGPPPHTRTPIPGIWGSGPYQAAGTKLSPSPPHLQAQDPGTIPAPFQPGTEAESSWARAIRDVSFGLVRKENLFDFSFPSGIFMQGRKRKQFFQECSLCPEKRVLIPFFFCRGEEMRLQTAVLPRAGGQDGHLCSGKGCACSQAGEKQSFQGIYIPWCAALCAEVC